MIRVGHDARAVLLSIGGRQAKLGATEARKLAAALVRHADAIEGKTGPEGVFGQYFDWLVGGKR